MRADVQPGERVVSRLVLKQKPHNWSEEWREKALSGAGSENQQTLETDRATKQEERANRSSSRRNSDVAAKEGPTGGVSDTTVYVLAGSLVVVMAGMFLRQFWMGGDYGLVIGFGVAAVAAVCVIGLLMRALKLGLWSDKSSKFYDPQQVGTSGGRSCLQHADRSDGGSEGAGQQESRGQAA